MLNKHAKTVCHDLLLAGSGLRQMYAAAALARKYTVYAIGPERFPAGVHPAEELKEPADALILPMPSGKDGVHPASLLEHVKPGGTVLGGRMTDAECREISDAGYSVYDYARDEAFILRNAVPTAEGAVEIAMRELPVTLQGTKCLILGGGRVCAAVRSRFAALGAAVTVAARSARDLADAAADGCRTLPLSMLSDVAADSMLIINTIPALILSAELLAAVRPDALIIDLASKPGGDGVGAGESERI
ncbi:MAG: hypothetical protein IK130_02490 [Oscillospiraceae bacterium]|nr:hypothetical protein [Oscillospiraceae bacterium]